MYNNTVWHSCNCWGTCRCWHPQPATWWCAQCCSYTFYQHYHPVICHDHSRDERLREEGRQDERARRARKRHRPMVDITPALPYRGC